MITFTALQLIDKEMRRQYELEQKNPVRTMDTRGELALLAASLILRKYANYIRIQMKGEDNVWNTLEIAPETPGQNLYMADVMTAAGLLAQELERLIGDYNAKEEELEKEGNTKESDEHPLE